MHPSTISADLDFTIGQQARRTLSAESSWLFYGWTVRLPMLPTPSRDDAIVFGYRPERVYLQRTLTSPIMCAFGLTGGELADPQG